MGHLWVQVRAFRIFNTEYLQNALGDVELYNLDEINTKTRELEHTMWRI